LCQCDCGIIREVATYDLVNGKTKSCGCYSVELIVARSTKKGFLALYNQIYTNYKKGAELRNLQFNLSFEEAKYFFDGNCFYCGCKPAQIWKGNKRKFVDTSGFMYNGIDRINNNIGYVMENCVSCCGRCNFSKGTLSYNDWIEMIISVYNNLNLYKGSTTISKESTLQVNGDGKGELPTLREEDDIV